MSTLTVNEKTREDLRNRVGEIVAREKEKREHQAKAKEVGEDIGDLYDAAVSAGYSRKIMKRMAAEMMMEPDERQGVLDFEAETDTYRRALDLPTLLERHGGGEAVTPREIFDSLTDDQKDEAARLHAIGVAPTVAVVQATVNKPTARTTVSINGGPEVDIDTVKRAVKRVRAGKGKGVIEAMEQAVNEELAEAGT